MSTSGISFSGLASGLDSKAIINALLSLERRPIQALTAQKKSLNQSKSLFDTFKAKLEQLRDKAKAIKEIDAFLKFTAQTDDEDKFFSVSASEKASPATYNVQINSLAKAEVKVSPGSADKDTTLVVDATPFTFTFGDGHTLAVSPSSSLTLEGLRDAINNAESTQGVTQTDVRATILDTGSGGGATRYKLVITSLKEGTDAGITSLVGNIQSSQTEAFFLGVTNNTGENTAAANAQLTINGVSVSRSSNVIADAIDGVTFTLKGETGGEPTTKVTVATDTSGTAEKVKGFVDAYNDVVDFLKTQNELGTDGAARGPLFGDSTLRQVRNSLRGIVGAAVSTGSEKYSLFSQIGIESDTDGKLTFTESDFGDALADDPTAIKRLFSQSGAGIAGKVFSHIEGLTDSIDGVFKARADGFDRQIRSADARIEEKERRLEAFEQRQIAKFAALESLIAQLQSQGSAFASFTPVAPIR